MYASEATETVVLEQDSEDEEMAEPEVLGKVTVTETTETTETTKTTTEL